MCGLSYSPVFPPGLSACRCGTAWSASCHLATCPLCPGCPSWPLLPVWMKISCLTPWLLDFHTVQFSGSSGYFLFLNLLLSFFWLYEEAKCIYQCLHLGRKSFFLLLMLIFWNQILVHFLFVFHSRDWNHLVIVICEDPFLCHPKIF